jgi:hypothetical protein
MVWVCNRGHLCEDGMPCGNCRIIEHREWREARDRKRAERKHQEQQNKAREAREREAEKEKKLKRKIEKQAAEDKKRQDRIDKEQSRKHAELLRQEKLDKRRADEQLKLARKLERQKSKKTVSAAANNESSNHVSIGSSKGKDRYSLWYKIGAFSSSLIGFFSLAVYFEQTGQFDDSPLEFLGYCFLFGFLLMLLYKYNSVFRKIVGILLIVSALGVATYVWTNHST